MRSGPRDNTANQPEQRDTTYDYVIPRNDRYFDVCPLHSFVYLIALTLLISMTTEEKCL